MKKRIEKEWVEAALTIALLSHITVLGHDPAATTYNYDDGSPFGPEHWGELRPEWRMCSIGQNQSPIEINKDEAIKSKRSPRLQLDIIAGGATLQIKGNDIAVQWKNYTIHHNTHDESYKFDHMHFHAPSEHTINGVRYPLEMHKVHESKDGNIFVIGVLYRYGKANEFLEKLTSKLYWMEKYNVTIMDLGTLKWDASELGNHYYEYEGSLTTPPCTEGVIFNIIEKIEHVSREQVEAFKKAIGGKNSRPLQDLNERPIYYYH